MKWSMILHGVSAVTGILGLLAILGAWIEGQPGTFFGLSGLPQGHLYNDATVLLLASIAFGIGTLIHREKEGCQLYKTANPLDATS